MRLNDDGLLQLSVSKDLDRQCHTLDQTCVDQRLRCNRAGRCQISQTLDVDDGIFFSERVCESILRHATDEGHLATLESRAFSAARTSQQTLMPLGRRLSMARTT